VLDLYFGENGIGYSLGRVHIGSCDFSLKEYNFDNIAGDYSMSYFDTEVTHDNAQMIPFMRMAIDASKKSSKSDMGISKSRGSPNGVNILASPWSPPPWMKTPVKGVQNMTGSDAHGLIDDPKIKAAYALYLSKFITAYGEKGIVVFVPSYPFTGLSVFYIWNMFFLDCCCKCFLYKGTSSFQRYSNLGFDTSERTRVSSSLGGLCV
jgi:glucosylceramidase